MKLHDGHSQTNVLEAQLAGKTTEYRIANTPHMFNILSSGLYSDKIAAVLREIGCNAQDAHVMNGTPELPFEVKLPTSLDRTFYIKDWGPGLDDDEVRQLYTTYGASTKQQSNDVTGAFGLGSKSPFAYTLHSNQGGDGFTVTAVKNGIMRSYVCHLDDAGAPAISLLHSAPAPKDWQHGVSVGFSVQNHDINAFRVKAIQIFRWFAVKPRVLGVTAKELEAPKGKMEFPEFSLHNEGISTSSVLMGNVIYPIDANKLLEFEEFKNEKYSALFRYGKVLLRLPIGAVLMTPAREQLQYTQGTRDSLRQAADKIIATIQADVEKQVVRHVKQRYKLIQLVDEMRKSVGAHLQHLFDSVVKGMDIPQFPAVPSNMEESPDVMVDVLTCIGSDQIRTETYNGAGKALSKRNSLITLQPSVQVFAAEGNYARSRLRNFLLENDAKQALFIRPSTTTTLGRKAEKDAAVRAFAEKLVQTGDFVGATLRFTSELEEPVNVGLGLTAGQAQAAGPKAPRVSTTVTAEIWVNGSRQSNTAIPDKLPEKSYAIMANDNRNRMWFKCEQRGDAPDLEDANVVQIIADIAHVLAAHDPENVLYVCNTVRVMRILKERGAKAPLPEVLKAKNRYYSIFSVHPLQLHNVARLLGSIENDDARKELVNKLFLQYPDSAATYLLSNSLTKRTTKDTYAKLGRLSSQFQRDLDYNSERDNLNNYTFCQLVREQYGTLANITLPDAVPDSVLLDILHFAGLLQPIPESILPA